MSFSDAFYGRILLAENEKQILEIREFSKAIPFPDFSRSTKVVSIFNENFFSFQVSPVYILF